jgi:hypothetical protein
MRARIGWVLGFSALMALTPLTAGCDKAAELVPPDLSACIVRRIDQIHPGWDGSGAPCLVVTWDSTMITRSGDTDLDEMGGPELVGTVRAAGYGGGCGTTVIVDKEERAKFASLFGRLGERALEWHVEMFLLIADRQNKFCVAFFDLLDR